MAKKGAGAAETREAIESFVAAAGQPVLLEPGEPQVALCEGRYEMEAAAGGQVRLTAWNETAQVSRRISGVIESGPGRLVLETELFGKKKGRLELLDVARPGAETVERKAQRTRFRERFRRAVLRQFAGWSIEALSTEPDLERTFSAHFPRASVKRGRIVWAAVGAAPEEADASRALTTGLLWLEHLRRRGGAQGLAVFVAEGREQGVCARLRAIASAEVEYRVFVYNEHEEQPVDLQDAGNLDTRLPVRHSTLDPQAGTPHWLRELARVGGVEAIECQDGSVSWRVSGLEFARVAGAETWWGIDRKKALRTGDETQVRALVEELCGVRTHGANPAHPLYLRAPELWLESEARRAMDVLDARLAGAPVYGQVPAVAGMERGLIDLLSVDQEGRLAVVELKASEDPDLPLQALDYWLRVRHHLEQGDFARNGYFPGRALLPAAPRLLLVAPCLQFHPACETILGYFPRSIEVERIGVNMDWREGLRVLFRQGPASLERREGRRT